VESNGELKLSIPTKYQMEFLLKEELNVHLIKVLRASTAFRHIPQWDENGFLTQRNGQEEMTISWLKISDLLRAFYFKNFRKIS